jgi:hypothetical protein
VAWPYAAVRSPEPTWACESNTTIETSGRWVRLQECRTSGDEIQNSSR